MTGLLTILLYTLLSAWTLSQEGSDVKYQVQVPCTVAGALEQQGVFGKNVLASENYFKQDKSIFDTPWVFTTQFKAQRGKHSILEFDGLNYYADIYVNGKQIASGDTLYGVFRRRSFDVTDLVRYTRPNELKVRILRAQRGDLNVGYVDWNPRPLDESMGIVGNVSFIQSGEVLIQDVFVKPELDLPSMKSADLCVEVTLRNLENKPVRTSLSLTLEGRQCSVPVSLEALEIKTVTLTKEQSDILHIIDPRVWWTYDLGTPQLYSITAAIDGSHSITVDFGVRSVTAKVDERGHRQFYLNGRPVLIKGAGWTDDIFQRDTHESNELQVRYVKDMGMNCIRFENIWGKDDNIYDLCDRYGILALVGWSCQWEWEDYCGIPETRGYGCINTPELIDLVASYFHDQVIRLHNHASIIGWMVGSDRIPNKELEEKYLDIYNKYDYRPYICSAKGMTSALGGPSGMKMEGPYEYVGPEYWYMDTRRGGAFGFNTETGIGMNIPQMPSLQRMMPADSLWPLSKSYDKHCTASSSAMNSTSKISEVIDAQYGAPSNLNEFVNRAHSVDYESTRAMFESFRCNIPNTTGIVQWMLNSAWPSLYWQLYDHYMLPTAAYYAVKKACEPVQLVYNYGDCAVYCVNESGAEFSGTAVVRLYDASSRLMSQINVDARVEDNSSLKAYGLPEMEGPAFLALSLLDASGKAVADNFYCLTANSNQHNWKKANWYLTPITEYADHKFVSALPATQIAMSIAKDGPVVTVTLENNSEVISYQNILRCTNVSGDMITPAFWSDNFVTLLPGETRVLTCTLDSDIPCNIILDGWNTTLVDDGSRDRSKYANDSFSKDESYTVLAPYQTVSVQQPRGRKIKNVIFMIGDGMGVEQVSAAWILNGGHLNMDNMPYTGYSRTYTVNKLITDSPAGGSALATGVKTRYGYEALDPDGNPVESVLTYAQKLGKKTGMVVNCRVNDATPFNYIGHSPDRHLEEEGAAQYVDSGLDFLSGGGLQFWTSRSDGRNLVEEMEAKGYAFAATQDSLYRCTSTKIISLLAPTEMEPALDRGPHYTQEAARKAIETLDNPEGFFLMIEGSCIDDWLHKHKLGYVAEEIFDFDRALGYVLEWAEKDGETLVVVTADHATGGMTIIGGSLQDRSVKVHFSTKGHNGILVPVFAYGPGAENYVGVHENAEIGQITRKLIK